MKLQGRLCLNLAIFLVLIPAVRAESRLIFPRLVFQQGHFSGIAIANPTATGATITLTAYNPDGSLFAGSGVVNPRTASIPAGAQYSRLATEIFSPPDAIINSATAKAVWMEAASPVDGLAGFFLDGNNTLDFLDGSDLSGSGGDLILPFVENSSGTTTELSVVNADAGASANVTLVLADAAGVTVTSLSTTLAAHGALQAPMSSLFTGNISTGKTLRLQSDKPLACVAFIMRQPENSLVVVSAQKAALPAKTLYFPQLAQGDVWSTSIGLANQTASAILVKITAYSVDGSLFSAPTVANNPVTVNIPAGGSLRSGMKALFGFADGVLREGWVKAEANEPAISGYVEYGAGTNRALVAAKAEGVTRAIFSHQAMLPPYYTGLAVLNPSSLTANVELVSLTKESQILGKTRRVLRPNARQAMLIQQWIPGAAGAVGGSIVLKSDVPVIATQLFGTDTFTALSNVPPQSVPADYDPGAGIPSLKVAPPLAVVETGKSLKFNTTGPLVSTWMVNGVAGGSASSGTVSGTGNYTAPATAPAQHNQTVHATTAGGDQSGAASVDVVQRETLTSGLTLLTAVAYFSNVQRFFIAEQQVLSSEPSGGRVNATTTNSRISEVSGTGAASQFLQIPNDTVAKMVPYVDGVGASHLLIAGVDSGTIYKLTLSNKQIVAVASGFNKPNSLALDPVSGNLFVSEGGSDQITIIPRGSFDATATAPSALLYTDPVPQALVVASPRGLAFDVCTGALYVSSADGVLHEFLENRERQVTSGLDNPGQILVSIRQGIPTCSEAATVFVAEGTRVAEIDPRTGSVISFLDATQSVNDLGFFDADSPFVPNGEESVIVAEGPVGVGLSRVLLVRVGRLYQRGVPDSALTGGLEFLPLGNSIAYRDRRGDTFDTIKSKENRLYVPDVIGIIAYRAGSNSVVTIEFTGPVAPASEQAPNSLTGWIDFDTKGGTGTQSHADIYRLLRPAAPESDAFVDLSTGTFYQSPVNGPQAPGQLPLQVPVSMSFLDNTVSVVIPDTLLDTLKSGIVVTVGNTAEITDIAPEAKYAFLNLRPAGTPTVQFALPTSSGLESIGTASLDVVLSPASTQVVTVQYASAGGSATGGGVDYVTVSGTLTFQPGETAKKINITIVDDTLAEVDETILVTLSSPVGAVLGSQSSHSYTILDDDPKADLVVSVMSSTRQTQIPAGGSVGLSSWTVLNQGKADAAFFSNGFYLSTDAVITTGDVLLASNSNSNLPAGKSFTWGGPTLTIPTKTLPGTYYIGILVDNSNAVIESNEGNNYGSTQITVLPGVDLSATTVVGPHTRTPAGGSVTLQQDWTLSNQGYVAAGSFANGYYLSTSSTSLANPIFLSEFTVPAGLAAGASITYTPNSPTNTITIPTTVKPGSYYLWVVVDHRSAVAEFNENNNSLYLVWIDIL